ncbi:hypothetical protein ATE47_04180 [Chryseobacterium sp. IHB B 17019]|nr:hypothetical protein ATE47_04180 [Chryseobacterium sp. IHB B 17019]
MEAKIGKYTVSVLEGFNTEKEAIDFVIKSFPDLTKDEVKPYVKPLIKKQKDEPNSTKKRDSEGNSASPKAD